MKKRTVFIRIFIFLILIILSCILADEVLKDKRIDSEYNVTAKVKGFYQEKKNTLDFVFVGSSQVYADIAPNVLFSEYGITSYDFCANEQPMWVSYYYIKEALKRQKPKAIVLDVFTVYGDDFAPEGVTHINLDDLPMSINKINAIRDSVPKGERIPYYFTLIKYHDTWDGLSKEKVENSFYHQKDVYKGYSPFVIRHEYANAASDDVINEKEMKPIEEMSLYWLDRIYEELKKENVDLILIKTPNGNKERQKYYNAVSIYAKQKDIPFINMNTIFDGEAHINILQAERVTKYVGDYLATHYDIEDKRNNPDFADWEEDGRYFVHKKNKCVLISTDDTDEYFSLAQKQGYLILLSVKQSDQYRLSQKQIDFLKGLGFDLDFELDLDNGLSKCAYLLGYKAGEILENSGKLDCMETSYSKDLQVDVNNFEVAASYEEGELKTKLLCEGDNYCLDQYGINVVVYDTFLPELTEFFTINKDGEIERPQ